jgi:hypothetical protein
MQGIRVFTFRGKQYAYKICDDSFNSLPGVCVSIWFFEPSVKDRFNETDVQMIQDRFGNKLLERTSVPSCSISGIFGIRYSDRIRISPCLGAGTVVTGSYFRQQYRQDHLLPYLQTKCNKAAREALEALGKRYPTYAKFHLKGHFCGY